VIVAHAVGRGTYARTTPDSHGFPRLQRPRQKTIFGFRTGDLVQAIVPAGKCKGTHVGRVLVRTRGQFTVVASQGRLEVSHARCHLLQRADGWGWSRKLEGVLDAM
jgi:hypothetical protein